MRTFENGQLFFIEPYDVPAYTAKEKALSTDITYLTNSDSVTMNMSVWTIKELATDSIVLEGGYKRIAISDFQTFYIEKDGKLWVHRYSVRYPLVYLNMLYADSEPFIINVCTKGEQIKYGFASKQWKKEQDWMNQILHTIATNKRLYK